MKVIFLKIIYVLLAAALLMGAGASAQTKFNSSSQIDYTYGIHGLKNGTAAQDGATYSQTLHAGSNNSLGGYALTNQLAPSNSINVFRVTAPWIGANVAIAVRSNGIPVAVGSNNSTVINTAISALSAGRTWKETVILSGNFQLGSTIILPSYTILDARQASLDLYANTKLLDTDSGATQINVVGGTWNGRKASVSGEIGLELHACTYSSLEGVTVLDTDLQGIAINYGGDHINLVQCNVSGAGNDGIVLNSVDFANVVSCTSEHNAHSGIDFYDGSSLCSVAGGSFSYNGYRGIAIESATYATNFIAVEGSQLYNNSMDGVMLATTGAGGTPRHCTITNCRIIANYGSGINDQGGWYNMFTGNQIYSNHVDGIYLSGTTLDRCSENILVSNTGYGIKEYSSASNTHAHGNTAWGNGAGYSIGGTGSHNDDSYSS